MTQKNEKSFFQVIVHSFFIIPFFIAIFCILLFSGVHLMTREDKNIYDYLEDVKIGSLSKRWQAAFELSKRLDNPNALAKEDRFAKELMTAFKQSAHDDNRVRQYLALAMGRLKNEKFADILTQALAEEKEENLPALIYALGMLKQKQSAMYLHTYAEEHPNARVRSIAVAALGEIADEKSKFILKKTLNDKEPNVQWVSAISLAGMGDESGKKILLKLLHRDYFINFSEVDQQEQKGLMLKTIEVASQLNDPALKTQLNLLAETDQDMEIRKAAKKFL